MSTDLIVNILAFASTLFLTVAFSVYFLVHRYPRTTIFWRHSDYVYFGAAILGTILGLLDQTSASLKNDIARLGGERSDLYAIMATRVLSFDAACQAAAEAQRLRRDEEMRIIRPPSEWLELPPQNPFEGLVWPDVSDADCQQIRNILQSGGMRTPDALAIFKESLNSSPDCWTYIGVTGVSGTYFYYQNY